MVFHVEEDEVRRLVRVTVEGVFDKRVAHAPGREPAYLRIGSGAAPAFGIGVRSTFTVIATST